MKAKNPYARHLTLNQEVLIYSSIVALAFVVIGLIFSLVFGNQTFLYNFILVSVFIVTMPVFILRYMHLREILGCEAYFTTFIDDLKEAKASGVSFPQAIMSCHGEYGALSKHIRKLQQDISWEVSIDDALKRMRTNLKDSVVLSRCITTLLQTYRSGGNVENILQTLRDSLLKIMESEAYRKSTMQQHVIMMYGIFFMYLGLIIMMGHFLIPMMGQMGGNSSQSAIGGLKIMTISSPCESCNDSFCTYFCQLLKVVAGMFSFGTEPLKVYYKSLFLMMVVVQGMFTGIIAGQISGKSWTEGLRHGLIMMFAGFVVIIAANALNFF